MLSLLYPPKCPVCGDITEGGYICQDCRRQVVFIDEPRCFKCGRPLDSEYKVFCTDCEKNDKEDENAAFLSSNKHYFDQGLALMVHNEAAKKIIYGLKYNNERDNAKLLAGLFYERNKKAIETWNAQVLIPVPIHEKRRLERGFNQAEEIAAELSKLTGIALDTETLLRTGATAPQKELGRVQRRKNIESALKIPDKSVKYKEVILVDDIYTTGSTIDACAKLLKAAGVKSVYFISMSIGQI